MKNAKASRKFQCSHAIDKACITINPSRTLNELVLSHEKLRSPMVALAFLGAICVCVVLQTVRPRSPPYAHMSGTQPFTLIQSILFHPVHSEFCLPRPIEPVEFPFADGFFNASWRPAHGPFPGWMPQSESCRAKRHRFNVKGISPPKPPQPLTGWVKEQHHDFPLHLILLILSRHIPEHHQIG